MFQKMFASLLTYVIGFQLMVGTIPHHALSNLAQAQSCASGLVFNEMLGRCVSTEQAAQLKDASLMCEKAGDDAAKKQCYKGVIEGEMKDAGVAEAGKIDQNTMSVILAMASLVAAAMFLITGAGDCPTSSAWLIVGSAVAVIAGEIMSAKKFKDKRDEALKKFEEVTAQADSKDGSSDNRNATSAQAEAFQAMIELEEATISAAKTKNMLYMVATAGYAAATVLSTIEIFTYNADFITQSEKVRLTCWRAATTYSPSPFSEHPSFLYTNYGNPASSLGQNPTINFIDNYFLKGQRISYKSFLSNTADSITDLASLGMHHKSTLALREGASQGPSLEEYSIAKYVTETAFHQTSAEELNAMKLISKVTHQLTIPSAAAAAPVAANLTAHIANLQAAAGPGAAPITAAKGFTFKKLYMTPMSRAILAGIMTVNNIFMIQKTNKEKKKAEERKKFLEKLKAQVEAAGAAFGCTSADRTNVGKPDCYCFSDAGGLNPARSNSTACKKYFGGKPNLASKKDTNKDGVSTQRNCVNRSGNVDSTCSCRQTNTCVSVSTPSVIGNIPAGNVLSNLPDTINGLNNGTLSAADINESQMAAAAARLNDMNKKLLADHKNKKMADQIRKLKAQGDKLMEDMRRDIASNPGLLASSNSGGSNLLGATSPAAAIEAMKKEIQAQPVYQGGPAASSGTAAKSKSDEFSLDALNGANGGVTISDAAEQQLAENMASSFDMGNGDINTDSGANIFNILSNRYQRSGMRRLFGGEALIPADKPSENPITP